MSDEAKGDSSRKALTRAGDWKPLFLKWLASTGNVTRSAAAAGVAPATVYEARKADRAFARQWKRALREAGDHLEHEAWRRAVKGVTEPVYQLGKLAGYVRRYSDPLLMCLLRAARPHKFRDTARVEHTGRRGGPIRTQTEHGVDLSRLTLEELRTLHALRLKAEGHGQRQIESSGQ